jgi:hypothetical protein
VATDFPAGWWSEPSGAAFGEVMLENADNKMSDETMISR